ncbi:hypothetical protein GGQ59_001123 [Parvularcula dongshanensis]|uniref:SGNH domain-containing protein n=2 Tax=Parvularcula dongshanensis TaxID=1173995 RepID=A0A840I2X7_9PROT|nr:hypothetical protein [Parvularcula dongshanensis]
MLLGLMVVLTFFLAYCSWRWIEAPFRNRSLINRNQIAVGSICGIVIAAGVGFLGGGQSEMLQVGWANPLNSPPQVALYDSDNEALRLQSWEPLRKKTGDANYSASNNSADYNAWFDPLDFRANLLLVGNSFSKDLYNTLSASRSVREQYELARFGVQIRDLSYGHAFFDSPNYRQANVVILVTRWTDADVENLASLLARVRHDGKTAGVVKAITEFPEYRYGAWNLADKIVFENRSLTNSETANLINKSYTDFVQNGPVNQLQIAHNLMIEEVSSNFPNVTVLDRMDYICAKQECIGSSPSVEKTFYDYGHHTLSGADIFGRQIDDLAWLDQVKTKAVR